MKNVVWVVAFLSAAIALGCSSSDESGMGGAGASGGAGGEGGSGGVIGPLTWTTPGLTVVGDDCDFFVDEALEFEITIDGSMVVMQDVNTSLVASTDSYSPEQDEVRLTGETTNESFPPCVVRLDDAFQLQLDDPDLPLDQNDTVQVTWNHVEEDASAMVGDCEGEWFVPLPCVGEATFTLTQQFD